MELIREIIFPTENTYTIHLPEEMVGKQIEIIAFEIEKKTQEPQSDKMERLVKSLASLPIDLSNGVQNIFKDNLIDLSSFKFNRDEANNYEE